MNKKTIKNKDLAHQNHCDFLEEIEKMALKAYDVVMRRAIADLVIKIKIHQMNQHKKIKKSDELKPGWTGQVPRVEMNLEKVFSGVVGKYLQALRWILLGDAAGKEAAKAAKELNLKDFVIPGIVPAAYLNSLDTHREHYEQVFGTKAPEIPKKIITESLDQISDKADRFLDQSFIKLRNNLIEAVNQLVDVVNLANLAAVQLIAHEFLLDGKTPKQSVAMAVKETASDHVPMPQISKALRDAVDKYREDWATIVRADTGLASAVGTHQSINEVFGRVDSDVKVAWFAFRDEKTCSFCRDASRKPDGSFKIYSMKDFQPAGYNYSRKKKDWVLCVPPGHYNCRCNLIYIPIGFDVDNNGSLVPSKK